MREALRRVPVVSVRPPGRSPADGQPVHGRRPGDHRYMYGRGFCGRVLYRAELFLLVLFFGWIGIKRTKLRLVRCRARMSMNDRDRLNDARADQNLADVARIPAPWDVKPLDLPRTNGLLS